MAPMEVDANPMADNSGFSISHQKVELDFDLFSRGLKGKTEITLSPHSPNLKTIRLDCRQCELKKVVVNGKPCFAINYEDVYANTVLPYRAGVHQYHLLQRRLGDAEDLIITLGKHVQIEPVDPISEEAHMLSLSKSVGITKTEPSTANAIDLTQSTSGGVGQVARFTPIAVYIEYEIKSIRDGMQFAGWEEGDLRYPHAYSTNTPAPGIACCLFPCLDELTAQCTWEISIKCSRTLGDAFKKSSNPIQTNSSHGFLHGVNGAHQGPDYEERPNNFSDEDKALELTVICTGDMTDDIVDERDPTKKTVSFICATPISAQHVGFAIGPFEQVDLAKFRESDEDDRLGQNAVPVHGFCLPGRSADVENTCLPLAKAVDFFTTTYGSYPFSDYKLCFVDDAYPDVMHAGCLSICSNHLLFPEDVVETMNEVTRQLVHALATQWIGIDIIPKAPVDSWVVVGMSYYMTDMFMRKLSGNNEYRYNQKMWSDDVVAQDINRPSLYDLGASLTLDPSEREFMVLKAPLVLFILDQRLKKSGNTGVSRVISRIFLNAKTGDLPDGSVTHDFFVRTCERIGHANLDTFFGQWVQSAGCPKFRVTQKFNKKKLVVEMAIDQIQGENVPERDLMSSTFIREVKEDKEEVYTGTVPAFFTGPMTIRIHEADGTPYEHIIEIKERKTRFEVPYNTKYKRLKRTRRQKERTLANAGAEYAAEGSDDVLLYSLGDVLQSPDEVKDWDLKEWSAEDEESMSQESYEWIRMDADFEWICRIQLHMKPYMWVSQLQQDRDVVAQIETMQFLETQNGHPLISSICARTLMDHRYFHGVRTFAASVMTKSARDECNWIGLNHLKMAFKELFCYRDSHMTRPNNFSDRASYYIQCAIPKAISKIRYNDGKSPFDVREFLLEKLKFNDNSANSYSDAYYLATLMHGLASAIAANPLPRAARDDDLTVHNDDPAFHATCLEEIDRYRRLDEWIPSYHNILSRTALDCMHVLTRHSLLPLSPPSFLQYTANGHSPLLRLNAFTNLLSLGTFKAPPILRWFIFVLSTDPSRYLRSHLMLLLGRTLGSLAIGEHLAPKPAYDGSNDGGLIIEHEASTEVRAADLARKQTVAGAKAALLDEIGSLEPLKTALWSAIESPTISLAMQAELLDICSWLYTAADGGVLVLKYPRYWTCRKTGKGKLTFTASGAVRTKPHNETWRPPSAAPKGSASLGPASGSSVHINPPLKREGSSSGPVRAFLKGPKPPSSTPARVSQTLPPAINPSVAEAYGYAGLGGTSQQPQTPGTPATPATPGLDGDGKPKIKLKLKMGGGGGAGSPTT